MRLRCSVVQIVYKIGVVRCRPCLSSHLSLSPCTNPCLSWASNSFSVSVSLCKSLSLPILQQLLLLLLLLHHDWQELVKYSDHSFSFTSSRHKTFQMQNSTTPHPKPKQKNGTHHLFTQKDSASKFLQPTSWRNKQKPKQQWQNKNIKRWSSSSSSYTRRVCVRRTTAQPQGTTTTTTTQPSSGSWRMHKGGDRSGEEKHKELQKFGETGG